MFDRTDPSDIERFATRLVNRTLGEMAGVPPEERQHLRTKGHVGLHLERYFGIEANSDARPDLLEAGVEIKAVPLKRAKNGSFVPKERTFITAIDYAAMADQEFEGSPLDLKTRRTLYLFYEHRPDLSTAEFRVLGVLLHARDEVDELMLREAHAHVREMVRAGRAHEISEGDTWGVGAATKDSSARDVPQPHSDEPARRRAFAWKPQVTARLWQAAKPRGADGLIQLAVPDEMGALRADVLQRLQPWVGASVGELRDRLAPDLKDSYKALAAAVSRKLLDTAEQDGMELFDRLGITVRTMRVDPSSLRPREAISFPAFDPVELANESWETSTLVTEVRSFFFMVFSDSTSRGISSAHLRTGFFWEPDHHDLAVMRQEWELLRGRIVASRVLDLPGQGTTRILHVRPHGRDSLDRVPLPNGDLWRRSSFWLNQRYLQRVLREHLGS